MLEIDRVGDMLEYAISLSLAYVRPGGMRAARDPTGAAGGSSMTGR